MRASHVDGKWSIDQDENVLRIVYVYNKAGEIEGTAVVRSIHYELPAPIDLEAPYWDYSGPYPGPSGHGIQLYNREDGSFVTATRVDVREYKLDMQTLSKLYEVALSTKRPEWAAAYVRHKKRVLEAFNKQ